MYKLGGKAHSPQGKGGVRSREGIEKKNNSPGRTVVTYVPTPLYPHCLSLQRPNQKKIVFYSYLDPLTPSSMTPISTTMYPNRSPATWSATLTARKRRTSSKLITNYPPSPSPPQTSLPIILRNVPPGGTSEGEPQQEQLRN